MKKHTVMLVILIISTMLSTPVYSSDQNYYKKILRNISPIQSIILLCDGHGKACEEDSVWAMLSQTHIEVVSRHTLDTILSEQKLQASGLTATQTAKIGKLSGASHILLYSREESTPICDIVYNFKLVNISTSVVEYTENTCILSEKGAKSDAAKYFTSPITFFSILNAKAFYPSVDAFIYDQIKADEGEAEAEKYMDLSAAGKKEYMQQKGYTIKKKQENK